MSRKWLILYVIILMYLPVSIDATVLHVAMPRLSISLSATGEQLLWIIDIYSLVMAGLLLPMGVLGDRIGFKRLAIFGVSIFAIASLAAALSDTVTNLIVARALLAVGAAMIIPATLSTLRHIFTDQRERNFALGIWTAVGTVGAAIGPLIGGWLMEYFYWGSVFLINLPIIAVVLYFTVVLVPKQPIKSDVSWPVWQALLLITAILLLVYTAKVAIRGTSPAYIILLLTTLSISLIVLFIRYQLRANLPMIDVYIIKQRVIAVSILMALVAMIALVGFELLLTQELQFALGKSPLEAGLFLLPLMISSAISGPVSGKLITKFGVRTIATLGIFISGVAFFILAFTDYTNHVYLAWVGMMILGAGIEASMLASTSSIMTSVPIEKSGEAGALEGMAYELGAGFGVAVFGMLLSATYSANIVLPDELSNELANIARASIGESVQVAQIVDQSIAVKLMEVAKLAFSSSHYLVLVTAGSILIFLASIMWFLIPKNRSSLNID
ncbi:MFS transporter [Serratia ureilytica]|uniref:MFS transporter n=1 Tax=Serratia ureilytica TaxID=300181 RepID=UPI0034C65554